MPASTSIGTYSMIFIGVYIASLLLLGYLGRRARQKDSMADFYLAGRGIGLTVLFLTFFATQYSGNTLIGFAGKAYRTGYSSLVAVTFMIAVVGAYLIFAPKLYSLSRKYRYVTPGDYIQHRYGSTVLTVFATFLCIMALGNYILTNLKAIGYIVEVSTGGYITFAQGIIGLSLIMVIYETLGGLRSVAWTDVIQGILLLVGCIVIFGAIEYQYGGLSATADSLIYNHPELWQPPNAEQKRLWLSTLVIVFFGVSIYPHAIQRIYAAKDEYSLRRSFQLLLFVPFITTFLILIVGIVGVSKFPGLDIKGSEEIALVLLRDIAGNIPGAEYFLILFLCAAIAAIMSTVDSALLAMSSLFTQDLYRLVSPDIAPSNLITTGKILSWILMVFMVYLAIQLPQTIWRLMEIKLEILSQVAPSIFLGLHVRSLSTPAVLSGMIIGTSVALIFMFGSYFGMSISLRPMGIHAGVLGLAANFITIGLISILTKEKKTLILQGRL